MLSVYRFKTPPSQCQYLADRNWQLEYEIVAMLSAKEYEQKINQGWRKFGSALFRPQCHGCTACESLRVLVNEFKPNRNQRRVTKANQETELRIVNPSLTKEKIELYIRHHEHHTETKGWPKRENSPAQTISSMIKNPFQMQEWQYYRDGKLIGVSYIDPLPLGYSGVYFYYDPDYRFLSPGTWIVLSMIEQAKIDQKPYVYLGYYVQNCGSMEYKAKFDPHEVLTQDGRWVPHVSTNADTQT